MTTRDQRARLPSPQDVDGLFDDLAIARLAAITGIENDRLDVFGKSVRAAVFNYLSDARAGLQAGELHAAISTLYRSIEKALEGNAKAIETTAEILENLPPAVASFLQRLAYAIGDDVPSTDDIRDPVNGRARLQTLGSLCASSVTVKEGRARPGGKRSRPTLSLEVVSPKISRGRPENTEEFMLCASLGHIFAECTGAPPFRARREEFRQQDSENPFGALVREVLGLIGVATATGADDLVRKYVATVKVGTEFSPKESG